MKGNKGYRNTMVFMCSIDGQCYIIFRKLGVWEIDKQHCIEEKFWESNDKLSSEKLKGCVYIHSKLCIIFVLKTNFYFKDQMMHNELLSACTILPMLYFSHQEQMIKINLWVYVM